MARRFLILGLLALSLAAPGSSAQTAAPTPSAPAANPVDPGSVQALKDMGAYLQTLKRYQVSADVTGEEVLLDRQPAVDSADRMAALRSAQPHATDGLIRATSG